MMHKAWSRIEELPYCFSRSPVKFQGHTGQKLSILTRIWRFRTVTPLCRQILRSQGKKSPILTQIERFRIKLQFEFTDGFGMMHKAWHSIEEVPYCFSMTSIKFPGHMGPKINDLNPILSKNTRLVATIKSLGFAVFQSVYCSKRYQNICV